MAKKIKKQIKRSMPLFVIIALICANISLGLVFDLNISVEKTSNGINVAITTNPEVQADSATTTVTVRNNPPSITIFPAENPTSASTTPVNMWASLNFTVTATDDESNDYYLIVCSSDAVTASTTGGPPECPATEFCVSTSTTQGQEANCTYTNVQDPGAESQAWYAFVCDDHSSEAECISSGNQGSGESGSPFWVNHPPFFFAVNTTVDNQDPGGTFTVTASSTDPDVASSADDIILSVCSTNSWATTTGCADATYCTGTSTSPDVSCSFATSTPAMDGSYTYYAFIKDYHDLAATTTRNNTYTVNNVAPVVSNVVFQNGLPITLNMKGETGENATTSADITDNNGCADISHATGSIYWSGATNSYDCSPDDNDCYQIGQTDCTTDSVCTGGTTLSYTCSTTIEFHAIPTDGNATENPNYWNTWWEGAVRGFDESLNHVASSTVDTVNVEMSDALEVNEVQIPYGSIRGGQNSGSANATTTIQNYGNTPIDSTFNGSDMDRQGGGDLIEVYYQKYATSTFTYPGTTFTLTSTTTPTQDLDIDKPTTTSFTVSDSVYWGIGIPSGKQSGVYTGTSTFTVAHDDDGW